MAVQTPAERLAANLLPIARIAGEDVRWTMDERRAHYGCPAVGVAVIADGELAWAEGYGLVEDGKPATVDADTMFSGASISKPYTAVLALQMVERGVFDLDADVNRYLKSWRVPENEFTRQAPVTLRWLLSHKAGTTLHGFGCY
ncbi:MAG TPA: serine hydrolase domain-containing protein, partial [Rhizomicrobium sp.]